mgnify:CR=1 FL=1
MYSSAKLRGGRCVEVALKKRENLEGVGQILDKMIAHTATSLLVIRVPL